MQDTIIAQPDFWRSWLDVNWIGFAFTIFGFFLAALIIGRMINEKREPSNLVAWALLVLFLPWLGVPLYFLFGGRKSRRLVRAKKRILHLAERAADHYGADAAGQAPTVGLQEFSDGNHCELLPDGVAVFARLEREIAEAERSIDIATYILGTDRSARRLVELLTRRAREGLQVRLLIDALGSWKASGRFLRAFREAGGEAAKFMPVLPLQTQTSSNLRNHRKIAIFDLQRAIVGGQNLDDRFLATEEHPNLFKDFSLLVNGPVVAALERVFLADWAFAAQVDPNSFAERFAFRPPACGESRLEVIASGPDVEGDPLWEKIITLVQECRYELTLLTPYFIPDEVLFRSLIVKAHAGRKIRLIVPDRSNHPLVDLAANYYLRVLHKAGVEVLFYQKGMLHAKLLLCDRQYALLGSANFDLRSLFVNFEIGLLLTTRSDLTALYTWVETILPCCLPLPLTHRCESSQSRQRIEDFLHLIAPLL